MKSLAVLDATLAALLIYGATQNKGVIRYANAAAAAYLVLGAYFNATGKIAIKG